MRWGHTNCTCSRTEIFVFFFFFLAGNLFLHTTNIKKKKTYSLVYIELIKLFEKVKYALSGYPTLLNYLKKYLERLKGLSPDSNHDIYSRTHIGSQHNDNVVFFS
jgi:hypothetical protein